MYILYGWSEKAGWIHGANKSTESAVVSQLFNQSSIDFMTRGLSMKQFRILNIP